MAHGSIKFFIAFIMHKTLKLKMALNYLVQPLEEHTDGMKEHTEKTHSCRIREDFYGFIDFDLTQMVLPMDLKYFQHFININSLILITTLWDRY